MASSKRPLPDQPGALTSGAVSILPQPTLYRAGLHLELQKFGSRKRDERMQSWEQAEGVERSGAELTGLELSVTESRALSALQILLDRTGYRGNLAGRPLSSPSFQGLVPRLRFTYSDFFEAYGLDPGSRDGHHKQEQEALQGLRSLAEKKRRVCYTRHSYRGTGKNRRKVSDVVVWEGSLLSVESVGLYRDLPEEEAARVRAGEDRPGRSSVFVVTFSSLFIDQIETFHVLKPTQLHQEIRQLHGGKRVPVAVFLFVDWLLTVDVNPCKIGREKLIEKLRLEDLYIRQRRKTHVERVLRVAIDTALALKYLTDWEQDGNGVFTFHLSPERCRRVSSKHRREDRAAE